MPDYRVMRRIILAYALLPLSLDLNERSPFRTLVRIIDEPLLSEGLLRSLYVDYSRNGYIDLQTRFDIVTPAIKPSSNEARVGFMIKADAIDAEGEAFLKSVSPKLDGLYTYLRELILERRYEDADWTIELAERQEDDARVRLVEQRFKLREVAPEYLVMRLDLENGQPVTAIFKHPNLNGFTLNVLHRP